MKILLVFPPQSLEERYAKDMGNAGGFLPPIGLLSMAAVLERDGHEVRVIDCPVNMYTISDMLGEITKFQPDVVGVAAITSLAHITKEICEVVKNKWPNICIIIGGPHSTVMPEDAAKETRADIVISGEADNVISDIVKNLEEYKQKRIVYVGKVMNLDSIPFPARHLVDMTKYTSLPNTYKKDIHTFQVITSRGCPFTCTFCHDAKGVFRQRSVENVISELKYLKEKYGIKEVAFWDDIFTLNKQWIYKFCEMLDKEKMNIVWSCYTRLDLIDEPLLRAMKKTGCWNIFFGIESGAQELLDNITKKMTVEQMKNAVKIVKKVGIEIRASFMLGLPGETPELARKTIKLAIEMDPDYAQFCITTPYPGTQLWDTYQKYGTLDKNFKDYHGWMPVFVPYGYKNREELLEMHREAFRRFYFRPKYMLKRTLKIRSFSELKRNIKGIRVVKGMTSISH